MFPSCLTGVEFSTWSPGLIGNVMCCRLWAGVAPRVLWIAIGGFIFLGAYDGVKRILTRRQQGGEA